MENLIAALAVDGKYLMANTVKNLMERDRTIQNVPKDNQKAVVQDMTARCLVSCTSVVLYVRRCI